LKTLCPDPDNLLKLAIKAAQEAGRLVREASTRSLHFSLKYSPTDLVAEADYASEKLILQIIMDNRDIEETTEDALAKARTRRTYAR
jgi:fructose-1,6-bisphosphatase/inositol monophosphatase family enzyme